MLKEEVQHGRLSLENLRVEMQDLEIQAQQDSEQAEEQISSLQEQLRLEREQRDDAVNTNPVNPLTRKVERPAHLRHLHPPAAEWFIPGAPPAQPRTVGQVCALHPNF